MLTNKKKMRRFRKYCNKHRVRWRKSTCPCTDGKYSVRSPAPTVVASLREIKYIYHEYFTPKNEKDETAIEYL